MILLEKPFVSDYLKQTIINEKLPVLRTEGLERFALDGEADIWEEEAVLRKFAREGPELLYSNSENGLGWMLSRLQFTDLPRKITLFKDKLLFRELLRPLYPDFYYREIPFDELLQLEVTALSKPFIIKPAIGFFSMGVHKVTADNEWSWVVSSIRSEMTAVNALYPHAVLDTTRFIIEQNIAGEEFAIDAYYDGTGKVVLLNILHHLFSSAADVSDRVYITSRDIMASYSQLFEDFLSAVGEMAALRNFPVHAEVRVDEQGRLWPVEINPMRFAGWCTTDVAQYAYGINPYSCYFRQTAPDWSKILSQKDDHLYSIVVLDKPANVEADAIKCFDYELLKARFENPLELRKIDYREYPVFGFLFSKTRSDNLAELEHILRSDLKEFIDSSKEMA